MFTLTTGTLLIAEPFLKDPNFMRTVVLICEHQQEGTLGFVLNRHHNYTLDELLPAMEGFQIPVYYGGPVQMDTLHFIHVYADQIPGSFPISEEISWGGDIDVAMSLIREGRVDPAGFRFFIGYSGWGEGQLEGEMREKSWILGEATREIVFGTDPSQVWKEALKTLGGEYEMMINFPIDPALN